MTTKKHYWNEYQKEIADDKYFYERSCIRQTFFPGSETAFLRILKEELGKDILDVENQHTCTGIGFYSDIVPLETTMTIVARLFSLMTEAGYGTTCPLALLLSAFFRNRRSLGTSAGYARKSPGHFARNHRQNFRVTQKHRSSFGYYL